MTPTERRRETARELLRLIRHPYVVCSDEVALSSLYSSLAKAEREGMKRAAEIAKAHYDARHAALARAHGMNIATAILSEAGEGGQ